ncbi:type I polyketide synthase [Chondromyces crocatus]|nr:type I polyketide synthase [Chondromyces crocatus]AIR74911.1 polyketide synthase [Chondromyces crocatus]AKT38855.1 polyketide synthase [Chondromyces crocatus]
MSNDATAYYQGLLKRSLLELDRLQGQLSANERASREPIAVIGLGCRFPGGGQTPASFWEALREGVDGVGDIPPQRWDVGARHDDGPEALGKTYTPQAALIEGIDLFDAAFFGISRREAESMDPQHRLLLEVAWEALEDAGQTVEGLAGSKAGVFVGVCSTDYAWRQLEAPGTMDPTYFGTGNAHNILAGRLSYWLDVRGPSVALDTACSSSLTAVHVGCQSLRQKECDLVIAGGVNLILSPLSLSLAGKMGLMAPDGRCKTFDAKADGMGRGEGCGVVILKRLSDALAAGDRIAAVLLGSAAGQDGRSNGLTAPNVLAQQAIIREAMERAGVGASDISYVEAHGTATVLGDPAEIEALRAVLGEPRADGGQCALGSVKTNIGHLEAAAGIAGLIKVILSLQHQTVPPHLHFEQLNPNISFDGTPFVIPTTARPWDAGGRPRTAGLSAFGWSGTNVHMVLQEASPRPERRKAAPRDLHVLLLSARGPEALQASSRAYQGALSALDAAETTLEDLCYTASVRRTHHEHRVAVVGRSREEIAERLLAFTQGESRPGLSAGRAEKGRRQGIVFVFPGQGSQWLGMGRKLVEREPVFRAALEACEQALKPHVDWSLTEQLEVDTSASRLHEIDVIQPTLFAIQVALAAVWRAWGVEPDAVIGHSMGEVAAACVAGALSLEDAATVICLRSRLLRRVSGQGAMLLVELSRADAEQLIAGREHLISVAVCNSPRSTVLSGDPAVLDEVAQELERREIFCRRVKVDVASHSPQMDPLKEDLLRLLAEVQPRTASVPMRSTVTGALLDGAELDASYWVDNLRRPVLFSSGVEALLREEYRFFLELSPHPVLLPAIDGCLREHPGGGTTVPSLRREQDDLEVMLGSLGELHTRGYPVSWDRQYPEGGDVVSLPSYPWQRERFWVQPAQEGVTASQQRALPSKRDDGARGEVEGSSLVADFYDSFVVQQSSVEGEADENAEYLSWGIFPQVIPGFSWLRTVFFPREVSRHVALLHDAQREARRVLFSAVDIEAIGSVFDFGCGHASDLLQLAQEHPHLELDGYTISPGQAALAARKLRATGLEARVRVFNRDSAKNPFPRHYDLILGIEVAGLIQDKEALFSNIGRHLNPGGFLLLADFLANTVSPIEVQETSTFSSTREQWIKLLSEHRLRLVEGIDISPEIANCLQDPDYDANLERVLQEVRPSEVVRRSFESYQNVRVALERGLISYVLLQAQKDPFGRIEELTIANRERLMRLVQYQEVVRRRRSGPSASGAIDQWFYEIQWWPSPLPAKPRSEATAAQGKRWLVFADQQGVGEALRAEIESRGDTCVVAFLGEQLRQVSPGRYEVSPDRAALAALLAAERVDLTGVVHLWNLDLVPPAKTSLPTLHDAERLGCGSLMALVQAIAGAGMRDAPRLWIVTAGAHAVGTREGVAIAQAPAWGLGATIAHEHPELRCTRIDLDGGAGPADASTLLAALGSVDGEDQIALRSAVRYVARLARTASAAQQQDLPTALRDDGTYLITGGLSGIGLTVAEWMVQRGARHLALVGRSGASPAAESALAPLRAAGAEITTFQADVSQPEAMARVFSQIDASMPPLRGVIHSAVALDDGVLLQLDPARLRSVMAAKMDGAFNLHLLTQERPLDFFILFSSLASILGSPGQGNYTAANAFVDALAHHRKSLGLPALSLNWAPWSEVGLAVVSTKRGERLAYRGLKSITPEQGKDVMERVLASASPQVGVMLLDLRQWRQFYPRSASSPLLSEIAREQGNGAAPVEPEAPLRSVLIAEESVERRRTLLETHVQEQLGHVLRLSPGQIDPQTPLKSFGFDSLMAVELRNRLEASLGLTLSATVVWSYPTVAALVAHLASKMGIPITLAAPTPTAVSATPVDADMERLADELLSELEGMS